MWIRLICDYCVCDRRLRRDGCWWKSSEVHRAGPADNQHRRRRPAASWTVTRVPPLPHDACDATANSADCGWVRRWSSGGWTVSSMADCWAYCTSWATCCCCCWWRHGTGGHRRVCLQIKHIIIPIRCDSHKWGKYLSIYYKWGSARALPFTFLAFCAPFNQISIIINNKSVCCHKSWANMANMIWQK